MNKLKNTKTSLRSKRQMCEGEDGNPTAYFKAKNLLTRTLWRFPHWVLRHVLNCAGLFEQGYRNALDLKVENRALEIDGLPEELEGLRTLFMSDLHFEGMHELTDIVIDRIHQIKVDICLFGGDFQCSRNKFIDPLVYEMRRIVESVEAPMGFYTVLGNHDTFELVPEFE